MKTRVVALLAVLAAWVVIAYGNRVVELMNPALLPTDRKSVV